MKNHIKDDRSYAEERAATNEDDRPVLNALYALAGTLSFVIDQSFHYKNNK